MKIRSVPLGGISSQDRAELGIVVTFENANGDTYSRHRSGSAVQSLRELCAEALEKDDTYRVCCISSPESVWRDIQGRRRPKGNISATLSLPEAALCSRAGLAHMLHPRLSLGRRISGVR